MIFALLTFLSAFAVAGVAGWFSIVGIMAIYAGAPFHAALVMGTVLEFAKLVTISWLYRNWDFSSWGLKIPLSYFMVALMLATSMGVFGFLTKSHLEQGAATVDNSVKVERLDQQIAREKSTIADDEKVIAQLDSAINSYIGKDKTDKAVAIRRGQAPQRKQLRDDIDASQKKIDGYSEDKLKLTSEVRALQLEVGPIRYIAELFYGTGGDQNANIESAVKMFTLLIVSTLDPLAIILLIAANHTLLRIQNEKKKKANEIIESAGYILRHEVGNTDDSRKTEAESKAPPEPEQTGQDNEQLDRVEIHEIDDSAMDEESIAPSVREDGIIDEEEKVDNNTAADNIEVREPTEQFPGTTVQEIIIPVSESETIEAKIPALPEVPLLNEEEETPKGFYWHAVVHTAPSIIRSPSVSRVEEKPIITEATDAHTTKAVVKVPQVQEPMIEDAVLRELLGNSPHFIPQKINEETKQNTPPEANHYQFVSKIEDAASPSKSAIAKAVQEVEESRSSKVQEAVDTKVSVLNGANLPAKADKYPITLGWLNEFKGN